MGKFVVTFFARNDQGHRVKKFPETVYYTYDDDGVINGYRHGMHPNTIHDMFVWLDQNPLGSMFRSYGIEPCLTDISSSSIIIDIKGSTPDEEDEILVTLQLFAGRDCRIRPPDQFTPRPTQVNTTHDRYAR